MDDKFLSSGAIPYYHKMLLPKLQHEENTQNCKNFKF